MLLDVVLLHLDLFTQGSDLLLIITNRIVSLAHGSFQSGNLSKELLLASLAGCTHVLFLVFDLFQEFVDAGLHI